MWKKQDDAAGAQPDLSSKETPDLASLGDALVESLMNEQVKKANFAVVPQKVLAEDHPLPIPTMKTYTEAMNEFTKNATAVLEQLPLLTKARAAYEEARRASAEMRKLLDSGDQKLQTLMTRLEQEVNVPGVQPAPDKKNPEPAKVERIRGSDEGRGPAIRWP
jgi:exonuclease VII small subunit